MAENKKLNKLKQEVWEKEFAHKDQQHKAIKDINKQLHANLTVIRQQQGIIKKIKEEVAPLQKKMQAGIQNETKKIRGYKNGVEKNIFSGLVVDTVDEVHEKIKVIRKEFE